MRPRHPHLLRRDDTVLVVVDMQEPFLRGIHARAALVDNVLLLIRAASVLDLPMLATLQYAARMGGLIPEVEAALAAQHSPCIDKMCFSCAGQPKFLEALTATGRKQVVLCGVETHICIAQTAMDLAALGYQSHVVADAVSARSLEKHKLGMERLRDSGVLPCAAEAVAYEVLEEAGTPQFKAILNLVTAASPAP